MKKLLALVLALVMVMGLATVSSSAAFSDEDKIEHTEAVEVMSAIGVINGLPDGSFNPTGNVTRAQMAKMITIISLGDVDAAAFVGTATDLTDIDGHWAEGYIKYCYSQGVISGRGNGIFDPDANVTAAEAAKMLLVAIGYNSDVQGYTGSQWAINVARDAQLKGFYSDLSVKSSTVLTRDEAAQMIYNAADATVIVANKTLNSDGTVSTQYVNGATDLLNNTFGSKTWVGSFDGNYYTGDTTKKGQIQVTGKLDTAPAAAPTTPVDFAFDFDIANIGEEVKVIFKDGKAGIAGEPDEKDTIYGVYLTGKTSVVKATVADISNPFATLGKIKVAGTEYKVAAPSAIGATLVVNNFGAAADTVAAAATKADAKAKFEAMAAKKGDAVKFVLNADGEVAKAYVTATTLSYISSVNSEKVTINGIGAIKIADNDVYSGAAKNDVVTVTTLYPAGDNRVYVVEKAEILSGEVKGFKATESVTLDGTVYKIFGNAALPATVADKTGTATFAAGDIGEKYDLYMVNGFVGAAVKTSESASNYSLVIAKNGTLGNTFTPLKLELLAADGSKSIVTVDKDSVAAPALGDIITYTGTADKALVKIEQAWATGTASTAAFYNKTSKTIEGTATAADAVLFVQTDNTAVTGVVGGATAKYKAYSVRDLSAITTPGKDYKLVTKSGKVVAAIIDLQAKVGSATTSALYGMVTADNGTVKNDSTAYTSYTMWTNDGEKTVYVKTGTLTKGNLYKYEPTTDNYYDNATSFDNVITNGEQAAIKSYNESEKLITYYTAKASGAAPSVVWGGEKTKAVASDVKVIYVNQKDDKAGEEIGINAFDDVTDLFNAYVVMKGAAGSDADTVAVIFIETSNEVDCDK